jgi:hypothetical protein
MRMIRIVGGALLAACSVACGADDWPIDSRGKLTLPLARQPAANEMLVVQIGVGAIGQGTKIVVRVSDEETAGTIVPYGVRAGQKAGMFTIPVPANAVADKKVSLRLEVLEKGAKAARAPKRAEIEDAKLAFIPATKRPAKDETRRPKR